MAFWDIRHILNKIFDATNSRVNVGVTSSIPAGTNNIGDVDVLTIAAGDNNIGNVDIASIAAGANVIGQVSIDQTTPGTTNLVQVGGTLPAFAATPTVDTELPAAAALADAAANPTTPTVGAALKVWNGTTWDNADGVNTGQLVVTPKDSGGNEVTIRSSDVDAVTNTRFTLRTDGDMYAFNGTTWDRVRTVAAGDGAATTGILGAGEYDYNGSTLDRRRNNTAQTALASAQRTATTNSADLTLYNEPGADFIINISSINAGTPSITIAIQVKDNISSNYVTVLTSAALNSVATTRLRVYPGIAASANVAASDILRRTIRVSVTHADAQAIDYSISMGPIAA